MRRQYNWLLLILLLSSCGGSTGHIAFYHFNASKYNVDEELVQIINKDSAFIVPQKWSNCKNGDYLERRYVYFKSPPEEIYRIGFKYDSTTWKQSQTSTLGLISQFDGDTWRNENELNNQQIERITKRFETEFLSKVKYSYYKSE